MCYIDLYYNIFIHRAVLLISSRVVTFQKWGFTMVKNSPEGKTAGVSWDKWDKYTYDFSFKVWD
jgi:hypothetical protein